MRARSATIRSAATIIRSSPATGAWRAISERRSLAAAAASYYEFQSRGEASVHRRQAIAKWRLLELLQERLLTDLLKRNGTAEKRDDLSLAVAEKRSDPYSAVEEIIKPI